MPTIGDRLKALRSQRGINQTQLGEAIGLTYSAISAIEKGQSKSPDTLNAIANYFKIDPTWLRTGEGEAPVGVIIPKDSHSSTPWKDEAYEVLKRENQRLWILVEKLSGAPVGSFLKRPDHAGLYVSYKKVQTGRQSGRDLREAA